MVTTGTGCRDRQRQLLLKVEALRSVSLGDFRTFIEETDCPADHDLRLADIDPDHLTAAGAGRLQISAAGRDWLLEADRPPRTWTKAATSAPALRAWQAEALDAWCSHGRHGVVEAVTGTGKSRVGIEAAREALDHDYNVIVMVPTVNLVEQWAKALRTHGIARVGALGDGNRADFRRHDVIVGTVQSLYRDPPTRADGKVLLVADECHRYGAGQWCNALHDSYRRRLGLTATFERNDDGLQRLLSYFGGDPVFRIGFKRAITDGVVAHYDVQLVGVPLDARERREYDEADRVARDARTQLLAADFPAQPFGAFLHEVQKAAEDDADPTVSDVARRYLKAFSKRIDVMTGARAKLEVASKISCRISESGGAIVFTRRVAMAEEIADRLVDAGVRAEPIHSELGRTVRKERLAALRSGRIKALVAPTILDEGVDVPDIDLAVVMGGSRSRRQMIQRMGRVLRLKRDGRKATFIVVYAENTSEDLKIADGAEGCLDLIVESADSVQPLSFERDVIVSSTSVNQQIAEPSTPSESHVDRAVIGKPGLVEELFSVATIDPETHPIGGAAVRSFQRAHGVESSEADAALRRLLLDLLRIGGVPTSTNRTGTGVLSSSGFKLALTATEVVGYRSNRPDALTWDDLVSGEDNHVKDADTEDDLPGTLTAEPVVDLDQAGPPPAPVTDRKVSPYQPSAGSGALIDQLERLAGLRREGLLSEDEYRIAKARILG